MLSPANRGRLFILAASVFWSLGGVLAKEIDLGGAALGFWRSLFAALALLPLVPGRLRAFRPAMIPLALAFAATMGCYLAAVKATTAANAIFLQCSATFWTIPLAALVLREKPDRRSAVGIAMAMVGVLLIVVRGYDGRPGEGFGIVMGLASGLGYAAIVVGLRGLRDLDPTWLAAFNNATTAGFLGLGLVATTGTIATPEPREWPILVAFGVVQLAIPYVLFARAPARPGPRGRAHHPARARAQPDLGVPQARRAARRRDPGRRALFARGDGRPLPALRTRGRGGLDVQIRIISAQSWPASSTVILPWVLPLCEPRDSIFLTRSEPSVTSPKTTCLPLR